MHRRTYRHGGCCNGLTVHVCATGGPEHDSEVVITETVFDTPGTASALPGVKPYVCIAYAQHYERDTVTVGVYADFERAAEEASVFVKKQGDDRLAWSWWVDSKEVQS